MKIHAFLWCLLIGYCGSTWAAETTTDFEYLYADEAINDIVANTEIAVIGQIRSIDQILIVTPEGYNYSTSSKAEFVVLESVRGYEGAQGDTIILEVPNSYIRYADTFMSVKDYGDLIAQNKVKALEDIFDKFNQFQELNKTGKISDADMDLIKQTFGTSYLFISGVGGMHIQVTQSRSHESGVSARKILIGEGDTSLILLSRKAGDPGVPNENSYEFHVTAEYSIYTDVEMAYVQSMFD